VEGNMAVFPGAGRCAGAREQHHVPDVGSIVAAFDARKVERRAEVDVARKLPSHQATAPDPIRYGSREVAPEPVQRHLIAMGDVGGAPEPAPRQQPIPRIRRATRLLPQ
jgi:hypothetical protein